jgi:hypothetical protein
VNGSFEMADDGSIVGWRKYGGVLSQVAAPVHTGAYAGALYSASESTKWAFQTVAITPEAWYEARAFVHQSHPHVQAAFLRVSWYESTDATGSAIDSIDSTGVLTDAQAAYRQLTTGPVQAPPNARSANVRIVLRPRSATSAILYVDDVSFSASSAPPVDPDDVEQPAGGGEEDAGGAAGGSSPSGSGSSVLGVAVAPARGITPQPPPVLVRKAINRAPADSASNEDGLDMPPWIWALAAGVGAGGLAWAWQRRFP